MVRQLIVAAFVIATLLTCPSTVSAGAEKRTCVNATLEEAGNACGEHLVGLHTAAIGAAEFARLCVKCLPAITDFAAKNGACAEYSAVALQFQRDCIACSHVSDAATCVANGDMCRWSTTSKRCYATPITSVIHGADKKSGKHHRVEQGQAAFPGLVPIQRLDLDKLTYVTAHSIPVFTIPRLRTLPPKYTLPPMFTLPPPPPPNSCQSNLLEVAGSLCGQNLISIDFGGMNDAQCKLTCSFCLSAVFTVQVSTCSAFVSLQASFSAQCQLCMVGATQTPEPTTAAPPTETSGQLTPAPVVTGSPAPTTPCENNLLETAGSLCGQSLSSLSISGMNQGLCQLTCSFCLSTILTIQCGTCGAFASIQADFIAQCQLCMTPAPTTPPPTVAPPTYTDPQVTPAPTVTVAPPPTYPPCYHGLMEAAASICAYSGLGSVDLDNHDACYSACSVCLSAVLTLDVSQCSVFASFQATFIAKCHWCAPPTTAEVTTTTAAPTTTEAQYTPPPTPTYTNPPPPTYPPMTCDIILLKLAETACSHSNLLALGDGSLAHDECNTVCCDCLSIVMTLGACDCPAFAHLQSNINRQCLACKMNWY